MFRKILWENIAITRCRACQGLCHDVQDHCGMNNRIDKKLKNLNGSMRSMWAAFKNHNSNKGARKEALEEFRTGEIGRNTVIKRAQREGQVGMKRTHKMLVEDQEFCNEATTTHLSNNLLD